MDLHQEVLDRQWEEGQMPRFVCGDEHSMEDPYELEPRTIHSSVEVLETEDAVADAIEAGYQALFGCLEERIAVDKEFIENFPYSSSGWQIPESLNLGLEGEAILLRLLDSVRASLTAELRDKQVSNVNLRIEDFSKPRQKEDDDDVWHLDHGVSDSENSCQTGFYVMALGGFACTDAAQGDLYFEGDEVHLIGEIDPEFQLIVGRAIAHGDLKLVHIPNRKWAHLPGSSIHRRGRIYQKGIRFLVAVDYRLKE